MSQIIQFPVPPRQTGQDAAVEEALASVPLKDREKLRFELLKTIDSYDAFFTEWSLLLPEGCDESFRKQIYDIAHQEHERKMLMLKDIMRLKIKDLVAQYHRQK